MNEFKGCDSLEGVSLHDGLKRLGDGVFLGCKKELIITVCGKRKDLDTLKKGWNVLSIGRLIKAKARVKETTAPSA